MSSRSALVNAGIEFGLIAGDTAIQQDVSRVLDHLMDCPLSGQRTDMANSRDDDASKEAAKCARYLKALGDPIRLQMIQALQSGPKSVSDFALLLEVELANVSHHLRVLFNAGLVTTERDGKFIYYSLSQDLLSSRTRLPSGLFDFGCCKLDMRSG